MKFTNENMYFNFNNTYKDLDNIFFTKQEIEKSINPKIVVFNDELAKNLELNSKAFRCDLGLDILVGNKILENSMPIAQAYAGHQFGHFTILGDGRAVLLGEHTLKNGYSFDIQLKGAGRTKYSRGGDGKATLSSMLREYIISEAMHYLKIPTTRSLAVLKTGETISRQNLEDGAILVRVAKSHIRVGTFEFAARCGGVKKQEQLVDYTIKRHFNTTKNIDNKYLYLLEEVIKEQANLIANWQCVGFIHGVMNTDNMSICGETIDYGPCAFMNSYNTNTAFSSIDVNKRYAYGNQPGIAQWNLVKFAETLVPLIDENIEKGIMLAQEKINEFPKIYKIHYMKKMGEKLGFLKETSQNEILINEFLTLMEKYNADFTNTFYLLTIQKEDEIEMSKNNDFKIWHNLWSNKLKDDGNINLSYKKMKENNPIIIPRNHKVEEVLRKAVNGEYKELNNLLKALKNVYNYDFNLEKYRKVVKDNEQYRTYCGT